MRDVVVVGSANVDLVVQVHRRPQAGETLLGSDLSMHPGGKGANQAAASARAGAHTEFFGCVGDDDYAGLVRRSLQDAGVDLARVRTVERPTGTAIILVTPDGDNSIVVSPGANDDVDLDTVNAISAGSTSARVLVLSMEIPAATVQHCATTAADHGIRVVLNAAPARSVPASTLRVCDPLIVNEHEARIVLDRDADSFEGLAEGLLDAGARSVVITLGGDGALIADEHGLSREPGHAVDVVDTTGAGDAFVGATACELARGATVRDAVRFAVAMSALSVTRAGAQTSYPDRAAVDAFVAR